MSTYFNQLVLRSSPEATQMPLQLMPKTDNSMQSSGNDPFETRDTIVPPDQAQKASSGNSLEDNSNLKASHPQTAHPNLLQSETKLPPASTIVQSYFHRHFYKEVVEKTIQPAATRQPLPESSGIAANTLLPGRNAGDESIYGDGDRITVKNKPDPQNRPPALLQAPPPLKDTTGKPESQKRLQLLIPHDSSKQHTGIPLTAPAHNKPGLVIGSLTIEILPAEKQQVIHTIENRIVREDTPPQGTVNSRQLFGLAQI